MISMNEKIVSLDIETENTGIDIKNDNKRIISIQVYNEEMEEIYYDGSKDKSIKYGKERISSLLSNGYIFVGYNLVNFDVPLIKEFLEVEIPFSNIIEISQMDKVVELRQKFRKYKLEEVCNEIGIECGHKKLLNPLVERFKNDPSIIELAKREGAIMASQKHWTLDFSRRRALDLICGGMAILEAYNEFVNSNGNPASIFYRYAMGDVKTEYQLYYKIRSLKK